MSKIKSNLVTYKPKLCPPVYRELNPQDYIKEVLKDKPKRNHPIPTKRKIINVAHVSDIHTDLLYQEGSPADCDLPMCCRSDSKGGKSQEKAGKWGTLANCDIPT